MLTENQTKKIFGIILAVTPLIGMGVDLVSPSLPHIARELAISDVYAKNIVSIYLIFFAIGSVISGFLSDSIGRRPILLAGLSVFTISSILPVLMPTYKMLFIARILQGISIGCYGVLGRVVLADIFTKEVLTEKIVGLSIAWGLGPILGPIIGSYLQYFIDWQASFCFYILYGGIATVLFFFYVPETLHCATHLSIKQTKINSLLIIKNKTFMGAVGLMSIAFSLYIVYSTLGPFLIEVQFKKTALYFGHLGFFLGLIYLVSAYVCRYLVKNHFSLIGLIRTFVWIGCLVALLGLLFDLLYFESIVLVCISTAILIFVSGILYPTSGSIGILLFRNMVGSASAIMSSSTVLITGGVAFAMSFFYQESASYFIAYVILMVLALFCYQWVKRYGEYTNRE